MNVVAIEGACLSGKTSTIHALRGLLPAGDVAWCPEYMDIPNVLARTHSIVDAPLALSDLRFLLRIEARRRRWALHTSPNAKTFVLDRSIHSLLAHRYAVSRAFGLDLFTRSCELVDRSYAQYLPDTVFYLDLDDKTRWHRRKAGDHRQLEFMDSTYNSLFRDYFIPKLLYGSGAVEIMDAGQLAHSNACVIRDKIMSK